LNTFPFPGFTRVLSPELTENILKDLSFERKEGKVNHTGCVYTTKLFREINLAYLVPLRKCTNSYLNDILYLTSGNQISTSIKQLIHFLTGRGLFVVFSNFSTHF